LIPFQARSEFLRFRDQFLEAIDPRYYCIYWLENRILNGSAHILSNDDAAIIYEVRTYPTGAKELHGLLAAGNMESIVQELIPAAEQIARDWGCISACIESRPGWAKALKPYGYEVHQVAIKKEL